MTRDATAASITESKDAAPRPFLFVELDYPAGFIRVNSTDRTVSFDSGGGPENFIGVGNLGSVTAISEGSSLKAQGVQLSLSGINAANISAAFENAQRRPGKIWVGFFDDDYLLVADPTLVFSGLIDSTSIDIGETATVTVFLESRLITWERAKIQRHTNENQQQRFAGDKFLEFINQMVEKEILWGVGGPGIPVVSTPTISPTLDFGGEPGDVPTDVGGEAGGINPLLGTGGEKGGP